jgi:NAD(P)-dependent dehydrogenase (short-subunit alcohol dehydrogenase family)
MKRALVVGNSDGIGLAVTRALLNQGYAVAGISRRAAPIDHPHYVHHVQDVSGVAYRDLLSKLLEQYPDLNVCIYCVGIGGRLSLDDLAHETKIFDVTLMPAIVTTELVVGHMIKKDAGHFVGLSSIADVLTSAEAPSYCASKAALSRYWEGLGLALRRRNVKFTNVRFGFVDTKMAKSGSKPFLLAVERACAVILHAIARPKLRVTRPRVMGMLAWILVAAARVRIALS